MRTMSVIAAVVAGVGMMAWSAGALALSPAIDGGTVAQDGTEKGTSHKHARKHHSTPSVKKPVKKHARKHAA